MLHTVLIQAPPTKASQLCVMLALACGEPGGLPLTTCPYSVERITLHDLCDQGQYENWGHELTSFHSCRRGGVLLTRQSMIGAHPMAAWSFNLSGSPIQRIDNVRRGLQRCLAASAAPGGHAASPVHGMQGFKRHKEVAGRPPDAVVYSSVLWDLQRWSTEVPGAMQARQLPGQVLDEWSGHFTALLRYIQVPLCVTAEAAVCGAWSHHGGGAHAARKPTRSRTRGAGVVLRAALVRVSIPRPRRRACMRAGTVSDRGGPHLQDDGAAAAEQLRRRGRRVRAARPGQEALCGAAQRPGKADCR